MRTTYTFYMVSLFLLSGVVSAGSESRYLPTEHLYPTYLADPYGVGFHAQLRSYDEDNIPETGSTRLDLMAGAPLILYERNDSENPRRGWQVIFLGSLRGQFDLDNSMDNVAWEGIFGLQAVFIYHEDIAWHFGTKHYSSHVGDEYMERTGRLRIGYTREEWLAGLAWNFKEYCTLYSDVAYAFSMGAKELQDYGRVQMGLQYEKPSVFMDGKAGWYSAVDISAYEEDDWDENITFQLGYDLAIHDRRWRLGFEYYDGRSQYGEFFQNKDKYAGIGVWMDL
jgi:hypothetical protein